MMSAHFIFTFSFLVSLFFFSSFFARLLLTKRVTLAATSSLISKEKISTNLFIIPGQPGYFLHNEIDRAHKFVRSKNKNENNVPSAPTNVTDRTCVASCHKRTP